MWKGFQKIVICEKNKKIKRISKFVCCVGKLNDRESTSRAINHTKITKRQLRELDRIVEQNPSISVKRARRRIRGLNVSVRTVRRYMRHLGWRTIRTKYCQFVSNKNRYERFIYSTICVRTHERFFNHIKKVTGSRLK